MNSVFFRFLQLACRISEEEQMVGAAKEQLFNSKPHTHRVKEVEDGHGEIEAMEDCSNISGQIKIVIKKILLGLGAGC